MLSRQQIEHYRETGWAVVEDLLDAALLAQARAVIADFVAKAAGVRAHDDIYDLEPGHRPEAPRVRRIKTPHKHHPAVLGNRPVAQARRHPRPIAWAVR